MSSNRHDRRQPTRPRALRQRRQGLTWLSETCPICGQGFSYLPAFKPKTCNRADCLKEMHQREKSA